MTDQLNVRLGLDAKEYVSGIKKASQANSALVTSSKKVTSEAGNAATVTKRYSANAREAAAATKAVGQRQSQFAKFSKSATGELLKFSAGAAAAAAAVKFVGDSITAYSNLEESINAVNVQFGEGADSILAFGEGAAESVGLANSEFNQLSVTTGAIFANFIDDEQEAADATIRLTQRAADLASVFNTDVDEALLAVQASLRGEQEPIRRFGVSMDDLSVKAKAVELGLANSTGAVTQQAKQMARLQIIYEQTDKVAGDFAATSDSLANSQKTLAARFEDAKAKIGEALEPVMTALIGVASDLVPVLEELAPALEDTSESIGDIVKRAGEAAPAVSELVKWLNKIGGFRPAGAPIFDALGLKSFLPQTGALGFFFDRFNALSDSAEESMADQRDRAAELSEGYRSLSESIGDAVPQQEDLVSGFADLTPEARAAAFELAATERAARASGVAAYEAAIEQGRLERSLESAEAFKAWEDEVSKAAAEAETNMRASMESIIDLFNKAPDQINTSVKKMVANAEEQKQVAVRFQEALDILAAAGLTSLVAELQSQGPEATDAAELLVDNMKSAFEIEEDLRTIQGQNIEGLQDPVLLARLREMGMDAGQAWAAGFNLTAIPRVNVPSNGGREETDGALDVPFLAAGGPLAAGELAVVGEQGPELFRPTTSGQIIPMNTTENSSSKTVQVFVDGGGGDVADKTALGLLMGGITEEIEWAGTSTIR